MWSIWPARVSAKAISHGTFVRSYAAFLFLSAAQAYQAADFVRSGLGISPYAWGQACITLGRQEATAALAAICARHADGKVKSPDGLLRCMVELHGKGTLRLDRTLFGLAAKLNKNQHPS